MLKSGYMRATALVVLLVALVGCGGAAGGGIGDCPGVGQPVSSGPGFFDGDDGVTTVQKGPLKLDGGTCNSSLADIDTADNWTFAGKADQTVLITVNGQGEADPGLTVIDPAGEVIDADDDSGGGNNPLLTTTLPDDGVYTFRINAYTEGAYTISVKTGTPDQ